MNSELGRYVNRAFVTPLNISDTLEAPPTQKIQQRFYDELADAPEEVGHLQGSLSHIKVTWVIAVNLYQVASF